MDSTEGVMRGLMDAAGLPGALADRAVVTGAEPVLESPDQPARVAAAVLGAQGAVLSAILEARGGGVRRASIGVGAAGLALRSVMLQTLWGRPIALTEPDYPTVAIYGTRDGRFIMLNGGYPRLREGLLRLLRCADDVLALTAAVAAHDAFELEDAIAANGLCGVMVRTGEEWRAHPQGAALAGVPVVELVRIGDASPVPFRPLPGRGGAGPGEGGLGAQVGGNQGGGNQVGGDRVLAGVRVLDLTHVIAGPTCAKSLAEHGAEVLHVYGPQRPQLPPFDMDTGHGKRSAFLDITAPKDNADLLALVDGADVFSQSYRPGRLAAHGLSPERLARRRPGLIYVSTSCYGHAGPWHLRPGFEQLAQAATGMAVRLGSADAPLLTSQVAAPYYPNDYVTGFLAAFGTLAALLRRAEEGGSWHVRVSLCRTAMMIGEGGARPPGPLVPLPEEPLMQTMRAPNGELRFLGPVLQLEGVRSGWDLPPVPLGADAPRWDGDS